MSVTRSEVSDMFTVAERLDNLLGSFQSSLLEHLDLSQSNCLNEVEGHNLKSILANKARNTTDAHLLSDTDEQLLLNIHVCFHAHTLSGGR